MDVVIGAAPTKQQDERELAELRSMLERMLSEGRVEETLDIVMGAVGALKDERRQHIQQLRELLRKQYGRSAEKIDPNQLRLALQELRAEQMQPPAPDAVAPADPCETPKPSAKQRRRGRRRLPDDLPREEVRLVPTAEQLEGKPGPWTKLGEETSEVLEYVPATFKVLLYVREKWSNGQGDVVIAPLPNKVIDKGLAGPGLLTDITLSKYEDCCPLARRAKIYARSGVELHRNTLVDWVAAVAFLLEALANRIRELTMLSRVLQVDDTHLDVLDRAKAKNKKRAHLWVLVGDNKYVAFHYTEDWTATRAKEFLGGRIGWTQVDGYAGYESIFDQGLAMPVGCWMHARRYFVKAFDAGDVRAAVPLNLVSAIYDVDAASKVAEEDADARYTRRQRDTVPRIDELEDWVEQQRASEPRDTLLGKALTYYWNHRDMLRVVVRDGELELDNGEVEREIRGPAMGRRNWLFAGSDEGAERAAIILTVLKTAKRAGIDVRAYLHDVLTKLSSGWLMSRLDELLPENWHPPGAGG